MYSVTKRIDFCYGHRLLDYDGICKHPHGHNAVAEIEVRTDRLDNRNMVCDFSDIKRIVKGWIDRELDHKMLLRHDDPLVAPLQTARRADVPARQQSDRRAHRAADLRLRQHSRAFRCPRQSAKSTSSWETPTLRIQNRGLRHRPESSATAVLNLQSCNARFSDRLRPRRHPGRFAPRHRRRGQRAARNAGVEPLAGGRPSGAWSATARRRSSRARSRRRAASAPSDALERFLAIYDARLLNHTRPYPGIPTVLRGARRARAARRADEQAARRHAPDPGRARPRAPISRRRACSAATARSRASPIRAACGI